jgi:hypothetical protein
MTLALFGCGSDSTDENIVITLGAPVAEENNSAVRVNVKISSPEDITDIIVDVRDSSNASIGSKNIVLPADENEYKGKTSADFDIVVYLSSAGTYSMLVTAKGETLEGSATTDIVKDSSSEGTPVTEKTVQLGAKDVDNYGSLFDVDAMEAYLLGDDSASSDSVQQKIDVLFWYSTVENLNHLAFVSPSVAVGVIGNWNKANKNSTKFKYVENIDFSTITTQERINELWSDENAADVVEVDEGNLILIKTQQGNIRLVHIESIDGVKHNAIVTVIGKI